MFNSFFGRVRQVRSFNDSSWVKSQTEHYFESSVTQVRQEYEQIREIAVNAQKIGQYVQGIYQGLETIKVEKDKANAQGFKSLTNVQKSRAKLDNLTQELLQAAKR